MAVTQHRSNARAALQNLGEGRAPKAHKPRLSTHSAVKASQGPRAASLSSHGKQPKSKASKPHDHQNRQVPAANARLESSEPHLQGGESPGDGVAPTPRADSGKLLKPSVRKRRKEYLQARRRRQKGHNTSDETQIAAQDHHRPAFGEQALAPPQARDFSNPAGFASALTCGQQVSLRLCLLTVRTCESVEQCALSTKTENQCCFDQAVELLCWFAAVPGVATTWAQS